MDRIARDREASRQVDEQRAGGDQEDVSDPRIEALADRDGDQEIGECQSAISSVVRSSLGIAMVIRTPLEGHDLRDRRTRV